MKSLIVKHSIVLGTHKTSVSLEDAFWTALKEIARERGTTVSDLVDAIDVEREHGNLSSTLRLFVLGCYQDQVSNREEYRALRNSQIHGVLAHT